MATILLYWVAVRESAPTDIKSAEEFRMRFLILVLSFTAIFGIEKAFASFPVYDEKTQSLNLKRYSLFTSYAEAMGDESDADAGISEAGRVERNMRLYEKKLSEFFMQSQADTILDAAVDVDPPQSSPIKTRNFLEQNLSKTLMPLSFEAPKGYWSSFDEPLDTINRVIERTLVSHGLNIYDGALWQMALTLVPSDASAALVDRHTQRLLSGEAGDINNLRGSGGAFSYGGSYYDRDTAFFFRMITDSYIQDDPLGQNEIEGFPNFRRVHHEDWKPITGEQAWAAIIGPLQSAYKKRGAIDQDAPEVKLALSILDALESMQSPVGALYHAPQGTFGIHPKLISVENNLSVYAALGMLEQVLKDEKDPQYLRIKSMKDKIEKFLKEYAYDRQAHEFYASGFYLEDRFVPGKLYATDCQTWAVLALGPAWIDREFGEGESYALWTNLIAKSARVDASGRPEGIGYTAEKAVVSVEWTCGAILAGKEIASFYRPISPERADAIEKQTRSMRQGIEKYKTQISPDSEAYWYSSQRYFVPFGWWANPIPSLASSAWVIFVDLGFNPLILGG